MSKLELMTLAVVVVAKLNARPTRQPQRIVAMWAYIDMYRFSKSKPPLKHMLYLEVSYHKRISTQGNRIKSTTSSMTLSTKWLYILLSIRIMFSIMQLHKLQVVEQVDSIP